jgi:riboflavin synthase alpha subunit
MKALTGYDTIKGHVMEGHDRVINDVNNVKNRLAQKQVRFDSPKNKKYSGVSI